MQVIAVANQKGGVAKTTTAINLGASLALAGRRVLLIDLDPQANLTSGLGLKGQAGPAGTIYEALTADSPADAVRFVVPSPVDKLAVMPADRNLTGAEIELVTLEGREERLKRLLPALRPSYDHILIDSPPSLGLLTLNALVAADAVLIPLNCEYFALEGIADLLATLDRVRASLNPTLGLEGVVLTMYDDRTNLGQQVGANIREFFGDRVYSTVIPRNIRLGEAPSHGLPVILYDARSKGADAYIALAREFLARRQPSPSEPPERPSSDRNRASASRQDQSGPDEPEGARPERRDHAALDTPDSKSVEPAGVSAAPPNVTPHAADRRAAPGPAEQPSAAAPTPLPRADAASPDDAPAMAVQSVPAPRGVPELE
jgi:chromosome partitioning protein